VVSAERSPEAYDNEVEIELGGSGKAEGVAGGALVK
jgi:hypothetical protein